MVDVSEGDVTATGDRQTAGETKAAPGGRGLKVMAIAGAMWLLAGVAGFFLNEGLSWAKEKSLGEDDHLEKIAEQQKLEFKAVHEGLADLRRSLSSGDRAGLEAVSQSITSIERQNSDLIKMVALARQENERTRQLAQEKSGITGGFDFILTPNAGLQIDGHNTFGLKRVANNYVSVSLSSISSDRHEDRTLYVGQSIAYASEDGRNCRISLLSINRHEAASFSRICPAAAAGA